MIHARKPIASPIPGSASLPKGGKGEGGHEGFDVDLRDALACTIVRDASFEEFRRVLKQYLSHRH